MLSEDAYSAHMEIHHTYSIDEEGSLFEPKVVITLTEDENAIPHVNFVDPLDMVLKEEAPSLEDAVQNVTRELISAGEVTSEK